MRFALFIGDLHQSYLEKMIINLNKKMHERGDRMDIFGNFSVPAANFLYVEGLKSSFYLPDLSIYDGIIVADDTLHHFNMNLELREHLKANATCPIVNIRGVVDCYHSVFIDNTEEMYRMTKHLIEHHKYTDLGFVTGLMEMPDAVDRYEGFKKAMSEAGLSYEEKEDVFFGDYWIYKVKLMADFFIERKKGMPQAIICSNDYMAIGLSRELSKRGYEIPEDVVITGFDNIIESDENIPSITSVDYSSEAMIDKCLETIERLCAGEDVPVKQDVKGELVLKASCGCKDKNADILKNYVQIKKNLTRAREISRKEVYMGTDFGGALNEDDVLRWAFSYLTDIESFERIFIVLNKELRGYYKNGEAPQYVNEAVGMEIIPDERLDELEGYTNAFFPIQCRNEIYGTLVLQFKKDTFQFMDDRIEALLINMGDTMKRLSMYYELFSVQDVMKLYLEDQLTGIYNRRGFERRMDELFKNEQSEHLYPAVVSIDIDGLKEINDTYGHQEGDVAIKKVADFITSSLEPNEFAARMGGDEFEAVIFLKDSKRSHMFKKKFRNYLDIFNSEGGKPYRLDASVGISKVSNYGDIMASMKSADQKMYSEKRKHHEDNEDILKKS